MEARVTPKLSGFFRRITAEFRTAYEERGVTLQAEIFEDELIDILRSHFRSVVNRFSSSLRDEISKTFHPGMEYKQGEAEINQALREFIATTPLIHAAFITQTTNRIFNEAVQRAIFDLVSIGNDFTQADVASRAYAIALNQNLPRSSNIATTITQNAAEGAKLTEVQTLINTGATITGTDTAISNQTVKEWVAVLDSSTRTDHVVADGQRAPVDEPFVVGGELLMYPGDVSLGASPRNTNHCRCGSAYVISEFEVSQEQIDPRNLPGSVVNQGPTVI